MKQVQRIVTLTLALLLIALPAVTLAGGGDKAKSSDKTTSSPDKTTTPSASPGTGSSATSGSSSAGQASPAMPMSAEDCKDKGWQKFGVKSEAECLTKVKK